VLGLLHGVVVISVIVSTLIIAAVLGFFFFVVFGFQAIAESGLVMLAIISGIILLVVLIAALFVVKAFFSVWTWDIWVWWTKKFSVQQEARQEKEVLEVQANTSQETSPTRERIE
jgi:hypothetical protein